MAFPSCITLFWLRLGPVIYKAVRYPRRRAWLMLLGFSQTVQVLVPILLLFLPPYLIPHTTVAMVLVQDSKGAEKEREDQ